MSRIDERQCIQHVMDELSAGRGGWFVPFNLDVLRLYVHDEAFAELVAPASFFVADGMPLIWASRLQGQPLPERVCGSNMILSMNAAAAEHGRTVFLLGGAEGVADAAADELRRRYAGINIVGTCCPPFGFEKDPQQLDAIRDAVLAAAPDLCYVALGCPKQEKLIRHLQPHLPNTWFTGVGASFDFVTGKVKRAPKWMQHTGLEWVHRIFQDPKRLLKRYLIEDVPFAIRLLVGSLFRRFRRRR